MKASLRTALQVAAVSILLTGAAPLTAATRGVSATGFTVTVEREISASPASVYRALGQVGRWWNGQHSWSGDARNLSLVLKAGGCFCERWQQNSVEHGRVIYAEAGKLLRLFAALGPLQSMPVNAVLTFELTGKGSKTQLRATYAVAGGGADLSGLAQPVDGVIAEQVDRLVRFSSP